MASVERIIFPGFLAGCLFLVFVTSMIAKPNVVLASSGSAQERLAASVRALPVVTMIAGQEELPPAAILLAATPEPAVNEPQESMPAAIEPAVEQPPAVQDECSLSAAYPEAIRQWCGWIETYSAQNGLDANLVAAVMLQESAGNPQAYSKSGAVGLMQVMPRDGLAASFNCINGPCFSARPSSNELFDPEFNISYATNMLAGLLQRHGNVRDALRSYGPMDMGYRYADLVLNIASRNRE